MIQKILKLVVYTFAVTVILPLASIFGDKDDTTEHTVIKALGTNTAHADTAPTGGGGGGGGTGDDCDEGGDDDC